MNTPEGNGGPVPAPLVSPEWLAAHLDDPHLRILDATGVLQPGDGVEVQAESGRHLWAEGHIPNSAHFDLIEVTDQDPPFSGVPDAEQLADRLSSIGVGDGTHVVSYDNGLGVFATRLWWLLRLYGFESVSVLDGGLIAWQAGGHALSTEPAPSWPPAQFTPRFRRDLLVETSDVERFVAEGSGCLINALTPEMHRGDGTIGYDRPGRIPGSVNLFSHSLIDPASNRFLPPGEIAARARAAGAADASRPVATYCGRGLGATMTAFALAVAGRADVAVYDGSLQEWTADPSRPVETG